MTDEQTIEAESEAETEVMHEEAISDAVRVKVLTEMISQILTGMGREIQRTVLADLLATWLAGHFDAKQDADMTKMIRESLLGEHLEMVRELLPHAEKELKKRYPDVFQRNSTEEDHGDVISAGDTEEKETHPTEH